MGGSTGSLQEQLGSVDEEFMGEVATNRDYISGLLSVKLQIT